MVLRYLKKVPSEQVIQSYTHLIFNVTLNSYSHCQFESIGVYHNAINFLQFTTNNAYKNAQCKRSQSRKILHTQAGFTVLTYILYITYKSIKTSNSFSHNMNKLQYSIFIKWHTKHLNLDYGRCCTITLCFGKDI